MNDERENDWVEDAPEWDDDEEFLEPESLEDSPLAWDALDFEFDDDEPDPEATDFRLEAEDESFD